MAESNHAALGDGLRIFSGAMRRLIQDRLDARYGNNWWDKGVLPALTDQQRNTLKRDLEKNPGRDRIGHLEPSHFVRVVTKEFDIALAGVFTEGGFADFRKTQSFLQQIATARNEWAHPRTGDMLADDVAHALYAMKQILESAGLPEAAEIERLRRDVAGIEAVAPVAPVQPVKPATPGQLPYWWEVCVPHDAFQTLSIDESLFAATLGGVHAGAARPEYADPKLFFSHTYFTENLRQTVWDVASRLSGGPGPAVTELQTPFGGGKTHALLTLYHLIQNPQESWAVPGVREALGDVQIPANARVMVFDGAELSTEPVEKEDGTTILTMWGELAYQARPSLYHQLVLPLDSRREATGNAIFRQVLQAASPCLILIDELLSYLIRFRFSSERRIVNQYHQTVQFVQDLLQEAGNVPGVCVLISLPKSRREFGGLDPAELQRQLGILEELQPRTDRVVAKRTPVNDEEIYTLISKRLFKKVDRAVAERVARTYREGYERTRNLYDPTVFSPDYLQAEVDAYPLHPELIDVLYKKWSTATEFPRTRAVLQLLASVVADQWNNRRETYAIQSAHVNLERERVRTRIVSAMGGGGNWDGVVAADIIGGDAHADALDQEWGGDYARHHVARGVATTLLMHSAGGQLQTGATPGELRMGTVAPNVGPEYVSEVMETLEERLWFVHREGERLRFQVRPNIYRMIAQQAEQQPGPLVADRLGAKLNEALGAVDGFRVLEAAGRDGAIPDRAEPCVAVLDHRYAVSQPENGGDPPEAAAVTQLWDKVGGGKRGWRNALVLVAPDGELWAKAEEAMREVMAYEAVIERAKDDKSGLDVGPQELRALEVRLRDKRDSLTTSLVTAYRWVFHPEASGGLASLSLAVPAVKGEKIANRTIERLADQNYGQPKVLARMGANYFNIRIVPELWKDEGDPLEIAELSRRFLEWTYLPILPRREAVLTDCIRDGLTRGLWAVATGDGAKLDFQQLIQDPAGITPFVSLFDGSAYLVRGSLLALIRETLQAPPPPEPEPPKPPEPGEPRGGGDDDKPPLIPRPARRLTRFRLRLPSLSVAKTGNLQPYLFKVLQEQDAAAELSLTIDVKSSAGVPEEVLDKRIVEGFDQLGISVERDEG